MIYLLEDDDTIRNFVIYALQHSGLETEGFALPSQFWKAVKEKVPDLVLLDRMLPEEDGMEVLKKLRRNPDSAEVPVILLTALGTEYDKVVGLDSGADDYITKPFGTMELISRVKAMLRRSRRKEDRVVRVQNLTLDEDRHVCLDRGKEVSLTRKEFDLLKLLMSEPGRVFTRDEILQRVWGYEFDGENRTVDVHIRSLRSKLTESGKQIETVRGVGYRISGGKPEGD